MEMADGRYCLMQGFQAAANIALDLDVRPMPKGPLFPRWVLPSDLLWSPFLICFSACALRVCTLDAGVVEIALQLFRHLQPHDPLHDPLRLVSLPPPFHAQDCRHCNVEDI